MELLSLVHAGAWRPAAALAVLLACSGAAGAAAQVPGGPAYAGGAVNGELDRYLRVLQLAGRTGQYPWSVRGLSPREIDHLLGAATGHPWSNVWAVTAQPAEQPRLDVLPTRTRASFNSGYPFGFNNGPVWTGRGATFDFEGGIAFRWGPLSGALAPRLFWAENASFRIRATGLPGRLEFADPQNPTRIDLPQRFGTGSYGRIDPGQSGIRLDLPVVALGVSTANQHWGPAVEHPILLGNNAPGYAHVFLGTSTPLDLWIAALHGRLVWGVLEQSPYSFVTGIESRRFTAGMAWTMMPRGLDGLELGVGRFFHIPWREGGPTSEDVWRPLEAFLKRNRGARGGVDGRSTPDNQLASVFGRWVFPRSGFEVFAEYGRNDHNWDFRDFVLEPDHDSSYLLGFQKVWAPDDERLVALRAEVLNARISHLQHVREQVPFYRHHRTRQGHTHRGQALGSAAAYGGGGSVVALDRYTPAGRMTAQWVRAVRGDRDLYFTSEIQDPRGVDVIHEVGVEATRFVGRWQLDGGIGLGYNFNRDFTGDARNVRVSIGAGAALP